MFRQWNCTGIVINRKLQKIKRVERRLSYKRFLRNRLKFLGEKITAPAVDEGLVSLCALVNICYMTLNFCSSSRGVVGRPAMLFLIWGEGACVRKTFYVVFHPTFSPLF